MNIYTTFFHYLDFRHEYFSRLAYVYVMYTSNLFSTTCGDVAILKGEKNIVGVSSLLKRVWEIFVQFSCLVYRILLLISSLSAIKHLLVCVVNFLPFARTTNRLAFHNEVRDIKYNELKSFQTQTIRMGKSKYFIFADIINPISHLEAPICMPTLQNN